MKKATVLGPEMFENDIYRGWDVSKQSYSPADLKKFERDDEERRKFVEKLREAAKAKAEILLPRWR
jgi:hypothetical protein